MEVVAHKYLGITLSRDGSEDAELRGRIILGNMAFSAMSTIIRPIITYDCETWIITRKTANTIDGFERKILRRILGAVNNNGVGE